YNVYRGTATNEETTTVVANLQATSFMNTGLTNGKKYFFKVRAVNAGGMSGSSNEASATPAAPAVPPPTTAPANLTAMAGNGRVTLNWSLVAGATSYKVFRGNTAGGESTTPLATVTTNSYVSTGLSNGVAFFFKVAAVNNGGTGPLSAEVS